MAVIGVVATCALIAVGSLGGTGGKHQALYTTMSPEEMQFVHYLVAHGKSYGTREEYEFRLGQFRESLGKSMSITRETTLPSDWVSTSSLT